MNAREERNRVIWLFSDGRPGHDAQSRGLISALSELHPCECHQIRTPLPLKNYACLVGKGFPPAKNFPDPDLLVGAGHSTHLPMLIARLVRGGTALVLMKPSLPTALFDYCLIAEHDKVRPADNIITTFGPINMLRPSSSVPSEHGVILVGGPSRHFQWDEARLQEQLSQVLARGDIHWTITDSPRSTTRTRALLRELSGHGVEYVPYADKSGPGVMELLGNAGTIWVSEDSMSMIYEALTTGAAVGVLRVKTRKNGRLANVAPLLAGKKMLTLFDDWLVSGTLLPPEKPLHESTRCARQLALRLNWGA